MALPPTLTRTARVLLRGREEDGSGPQITRESIDILKETFREDMSKEDWLLIVKLKKEFKIQ